jgi:hypothetical protein
MNYTAKADPSLIPDIEAFEERVAIMVHEGGILTDKAKDLAAQAQGFRSQAHYWAWLRVYVERKRLGEGSRPKIKLASQSGGLGILRYFLQTGLG